MADGLEFLAKLGPKPRVRWLRTHELRFDHDTGTFFAPVPNGSQVPLPIPNCQTPMVAFYQVVEGPEPKTVIPHWANELHYGASRKQINGSIILVPEGLPQYA
ncbi:hypothetical protein HY487_00365 [Candidatus Woesearchaeota archaeon]|nr:hypothetical protein [Candidatus Woesearchaeota archaeon]